MKNEVIAWPKATGTAQETPKPIKRPCDHGLDLAFMNLETQLGTIEAYNRLVAKAQLVKRLIDTGDVRAQNPCYAVKPRG